MRTNPIWWSTRAWEVHGVHDLSLTRTGGQENQWEKESLAPKIEEVQEGGGRQRGNAHEKEEKADGGDPRVVVFQREQSLLAVVGEADKWSVRISPQLVVHRLRRIHPMTVQFRQGRRADSADRLLIWICFGVILKHIQSRSVSNWEVFEALKLENSTVRTETLQLLHSIISKSTDEQICLKHCGYRESIAELRSHGQEMFQLNAVDEHAVQQCQVFSTERSWSPLERMDWTWWRWREKKVGVSEIELESPTMVMEEFFQTRWKIVSNKSVDSLLVRITKSQASPFRANIFDVWWHVERGFLRLSSFVGHPNFTAWPCWLWRCTCGGDQILPQVVTTTLYERLCANSPAKKRLPHPKSAGVLNSRRWSFLGSRARERLICIFAWLLLLRTEWAPFQPKSRVQRLYRIWGRRCFVVLFVAVPQIPNLTVDQLCKIIDKTDSIRPMTQGLAHLQDMQHLRQADGRSPFHRHAGGREEGTGSRRTRSAHWSW